jgi:hypothetical protein
VDELDMDLECKELKVRLGGKLYILREADGDAVVKWRDSQLKAARMKDTTIVGMDGFAASQTVLVHRCLFEAGPDGRAPMIANTSLLDKSACVPMSTILAWPGRVQEKLYNWIMDNSGLRAKDEEAAKNSPSATTGGSA